MRALVISALADSRKRPRRHGRDATVLVHIEKISHYGMAGYGAAHEFARAMGEQKVSSLLRKSYKEKKQAIGEEATILRRIVVPKLRLN